MASELFNRDAFDLLASLPDGSIDATITDPPYGTTQNDWDIAPDWGRLTSELLRVTKGAVCIFSQMPVACDVVAAARGNFRYQIVWRKDRSTGFLDANRRPLRAHEVILVFSAKGYGEYHPQFTRGTPYENLNGANHTSNYGSFATTYSVNDGRRHPTDVIDFGVVRNTSGGVIRPRNPSTCCAGSSGPTRRRAARSSTPSAGRARRPSPATARGATSWAASLTPATTPGPRTA